MDVELWLNEENKWTKAMKITKLDRKNDFY